MSDSCIETVLCDWLKSIIIRRRQIILHIQEPFSPSISMIRGAWGRAIHLLNIEAYRSVFEGIGPPHFRQPSYMLRPSENNFSARKSIFYLDWITWGHVDSFDSFLCRAWDMASGMGLGKKRIPFTVSMSSESDSLFSLGDIPWPLNNHPDSTPFRYLFQMPLRIIRHGRLVTSPSLPDIVESIIFRCALVRNSISETISDNTTPKSCWPDFAEAMIALSTTIRSTPWRGQQRSIVRYSAKQESEVKINGVCGFIDFPEGVGPLWPLLVAATWLHIGKGTCIGMGRPEITAIEKT